MECNIYSSLVTELFKHALLTIPKIKEWEQQLDYITIR